MLYSEGGTEQRPAFWRASDFNRQCDKPIPNIRRRIPRNTLISDNSTESATQKVMALVNKFQFGNDT